MYIDCDGIKLNSYLDMPEGKPEKCPLCIMIHGFTGHSEERHIIGVQEALNEIGVATLRADMYGHGKSDGTRSLSGSRILWLLLTMPKSLTLSRTYIWRVIRREDYR